ncbi:MAG: hypothetical protein WAL56_06865 [Candidatus Sulfotelmatobacter sp.]
MSTTKFARIVGFTTAGSMLLALAGCGSSSSQSTSNTITASLSQYSSSYAGAISDFTSDSNHHVQALLFPVLTSNSPIYNSFLQNVLPNISGVSVSMSWNQIETTQGVYEFSSFDASLAPFEQSGKMVNLIVWPATEGGDNNPSDGGSTPPYVFTQAWASSVNAPNPQDMAVCSSYPGDTSNPFYSQTQGGSGGVWNSTTSSDISGLPVSYEAPFAVAYQNFIATVIAHYNAPGAPAIGYIRFGFSQGGEDSPECNQYWGPPGAPNYSESAYLAYVLEMTNFVKQQSPSMTILADMHAVGPPGSVDFGYADTEAVDAVDDVFGIGTNGLQQSDTTAAQNGQTCDSDWCATFAKYHTDFNGQSNITLSLQTLQWTDPTNAAQTGSLTVLEPFAKSNYANNLELYLADVGLAYDLSNYCSYPHNACASINGSDQKPAP